MNYQMILFIIRRKTSIFQMRNQFSMIYSKVQIQIETNRSANREKNSQANLIYANYIQILLEL